MKVGSKIALGYFILALMVVVVGVTGYRAIFSVGQNFNQAINQTQPVLQALQDIRYQAMRLLLDSHLAAHGAKSARSGSQAEVSGAVRELDAAAARHYALVKRYFPGELEEATAIGEKIGLIKAQATRLYGPDNPGLATEADFRALAAAVQDLVVAIDNAEASEAEELQGYQRGVDDEIAAHELVIAAASGAALLATLFGAGFILRRLWRPIVALRDAARQIGLGELDTRVAVADGSEIGDLVRAFNAMAEQLAGSMVSRAYVENIIESMAEGVIVVGASGRVERVNRAFRQLYAGTPENTLEGYALSDFFSEPEALQRVLTMDSPQRRVELEMRTADARSLTVALSSAGLQGEGEQAGTVVLVQDITERKRAALQLQMQSAALNAADSAVIITDPTGRIEWVNPAFTSLTGYSAAEAIGHNPREILKSGVHSRKFYTKLWNTILAGETWHGEMVNRRKDGGTYVEEMTIAPVQDEDWNITHFVAIQHDISARKRTEEALRKSEALLRSISDNLPDCAIFQVMISPMGEIRATYISNAIEKLIGVPAADIMADASKLHAAIHPDDRQRMVDTTDRAIRTGSDFGIEVRMLHSNGRMRWLSFRSSRRTEADGCTIWDGVIEDISPRVAAEEALVAHRLHLEKLVESRTAQLRQMNATLEQRVEERTLELQRAKEVAERASRAKTRFLANMSHELRTPLTSLMLIAQLLADNMEGNLSDRQVEFAQMIGQSGSDLLYLINDLLDLARIEAGKLAVEAKDVLFPDLLRDVQRIHREMARQKGLEFAIEVAADVPAAIVTDPLRLQQVLRNLVGNAIKFTHAGSVTLSVRRAESGWSAGHPVLDRAVAVIAFDVVDTGIGIPSELQSRIFEPFEQGDASSTRPHGGAGLGLPISQQIAALLGGELTLVSQAGTGSTFTLYLPANRVAGPGADGTAPESAARGAGSDPALVGKTILLVDDDQRNRIAMQALLEQWGLRVLTASDGKAALEVVFGRTDIDLVLMDMMMPVLDGYAATRALRERYGPLCLPIVALTADAMPETRERCAAAGCSDYLVKPVNSDELRASLKKFMLPADKSAEIG